MRLLFLLVVLLFPGPGAADGLRVMVYDLGTASRGPGIALRDIERGTARYTAIATMIARHPPDILMLTGIDHDRDGQTLGAFSRLLERHGIGLPHRYAGPQNQGMQTGADLDGDGATGGPDDALGYARFPGADGMALLSRFPLDTDAVRSWTRLPWAAVPGGGPPTDAGGGAFFPGQWQARLPLAARGLWLVPVRTPCGRIDVLFGYGPPPIYDGPEDRNGRRAGAHARFWRQLIEGAALPDDAGARAPISGHTFVLGGNFGIDPARGDGDRAAMQALLALSRLHRWTPAGAAGTATADYRAGPMRTSYLLVSADLAITGGGVDWPPDGTQAAATASAASHHRPVWADIACPE